MLLKEFTVKYVTVGKNKEVLENQCQLVITVDKFLHIFMNCNKNLCEKPDITLKIGVK